MLNTIDFINDLKQYLKTSIITLDSDFSTLDTYTAYTYEHTPTPPEINVYINDDSEDTISNSYDGENISSVSVNIYCYAGAMLLNNDSTKTSAVDSTAIPIFKPILVNAFLLVLIAIIFLLFNYIFLYSYF